MATICISPPDRFSHSRCIRYSSAEKISKHSFSRPARESASSCARWRGCARRVSVGKMRRSSGTQPMPRRAISCVGARVMSARRSGSLPRRAGVSPSTERSVVVLPAPFGPSSATTSPAADRERDVEQHLRLAVERVDAVERRASRCTRRGSSAAPRFSRSSAGVPSAITWPQWITETVSARPNRKRMSCSMTTIVSCRFSSRDELGKPRRRLRAEAGSRLVEKEQARLARRARRAISSARRSPYDRLLRRRALLAGEADAREHRGRLVLRGACRRRGRARRRSPRRRTRGSATRTLSSAESSSNRFMTWNEREMPRRAIARGARPVMSSPSNAHARRGRARSVRSAR